MNRKPFAITPAPLAIALVLALAACGKAGPGPAAEPSAGADAAHPDEHAGHDEHQRVVLSEAQLATAGIGLAAAGPATVRETLPLYGVVAPNAEKVLTVVARYPGVIRAVGKRVGDAVRRGEVLATVESDESLQSYAVTAPIDGVVTARNANPGEQSGDRSLFTVADLSTVWVELAIFPRDAARVRVGQAVRVRSDQAGLAADGKLVYLAPFGSAANQTLAARVLLDNASRRWAPGLYVTAEVTLAETPVPLAVRNEALQTLEGRTVVFVREADGFEPRGVRLGRADGEVSEVLDGLQAQEAYATANSFILKAELGKGEAEHEH